MFLRPITATVAADGTITLDAHPVALVCGGPDDLHYDVSTSIETVHLVAGALIQRVGSPPTHEVTITPSELDDYMAGVPESGDFLVTGPLDAITALQEQYHP